MIGSVDAEGRSHPLLPPACLPTALPTRPIRGVLSMLSTHRSGKRPDLLPGQTRIVAVDEGDALLVHLGHRDGEDSRERRIRQGRQRIGGRASRQSGSRFVALAVCRVEQREHLPFSGVLLRVYFGRGIAGHIVVHGHGRIGEE